MTMTMSIRRIGAGSRSGPFLLRLSGVMSALFLVLAAGCGGTEPEAEDAASESIVASTLNDDADSDAGVEPDPGSDSDSDPDAGSDTGSDSDNEPEPPAGEPVDVGRVEAVGAAVGADVILARLDQETVVIWNEGRSVEVAVPADTWIWSDGRFVYRSTGNEVDGEIGGKVRALDETVPALDETVLALDGTVVCQVDGRIHHATERTDGTVVVAVESEVPADWDGSGQYPVPMHAVDCGTGERQAIEPVTIYGQDGEVRFIERKAGRVFTGRGDAEGNADFDNEAGLSINGQDYAGYHTFSPDASIVIYGDMTITGPHLSPVVVARDTTSGRQLWRTEFDIAFRSLWFVGDRPAIGFVDDETARIDFREGIDRLVVLDPATGDPLEEFAVGFDLLFVG